jgi:hypothetical protein
MLTERKTGEPGLLPARDLDLGTSVRFGCAGGNLGGRRCFDIGLSCPTSHSPIENGRTSVFMLFVVVDVQMTVDLVLGVHVDVHLHLAV